MMLPDGETEANIFAEGKLVGKRSEIEGVWLSDAMKDAEDAAIERQIRTAGLTLSDIQKLFDSGVKCATHATDPRLKPYETYCVDIEQISKEVNAFTASQAERERHFNERIEWMLQSKRYNMRSHDIPKDLGPQTGIAICIDNLYFGNIQ